jgi:hypothetical protein
MLDFFVEIIQGPCLSNQISISKSKIPDILEELSTSLIYEYDEVNDKSKSKLINAMVLIQLGLLENTKSDLVISKVSLNTNIDALWDRIAYIYALINNLSFKNHEA